MSSSGVGAVREPPLPLCQLLGSSCGACCGLYNLAEHDRSSVHALLSRRTRAFALTPRTPDGYRECATRLTAGEPAPLFPLVRKCPLLGFLDESQTRIGCLGHPLSTGGTDLRDCGTYTAQICDSFLCPSHFSLSEKEARLVAEVCSDAYLYGLVITDAPFIRHCLGTVPSRALRDLFTLKEELAPGSEGIYGAFREIRADPPPTDDILSCLGADTRSGNDLSAIEDELRRRLEAAKGDA